MICEREDYFFLETIRDYLKKNFMGVDGIVDIYWIPYHNVLGHGKHDWYIKVRYVSEVIEMASIYDKELELCAEYPNVMFSFMPVRPMTYDTFENLALSMDRSGFVPLTTVNSEKTR